MTRLSAVNIRSNVVGFAVLFLVGCGGNSDAQQQRTNATAAWVEQMATVYFEPRPSGEVRIARFNNTDAIVPLMNGLRASLNDARNDKLTMPGRIAVLTSYRPVWRGDSLVQAEWDVRSARLKQIPDIEIEPWQKAFTTAEGNAVPDVYAMLILSDLPELFPAEKFDSAKSSAARNRLSQVPPDAIKALASVLKMGGSDATVLILRNPDFFNATGFRKPAFDAALQQLQARLATAK